MKEGATTGDGDATMDATHPYYEHFGVCPTCGHYDTIVHVGKYHYAVCTMHRVRWRIGYNLFSKVAEMSESEKQAGRDKVGFEWLSDVESIHDGPAVQRLREGNAAAQMERLTRTRGED